MELSRKLTGAIAVYATEKGYSVHDSMKVTRASLNGDSFAADVLRISIGKPNKDINDNDTGNRYVIKFKAKRSTTPNVSSLPRVLVTSADPVTELRLIAKVAPKSEFRREMYKISTLFGREKSMYQTILPEFRDFQLKHSRSGGKLFDNYPRVIGSCDDVSDEFILFSDLCEEGYKNLDRTQGCSLRVCKAVLERFARLHAISFVYQAVDKKRFQKLVGDRLKETLFVKDIPESFMTFLQSKVDLIVSILNESEPKEIDVQVLDKLKDFRTDCGRAMYETCHVQDYAVVCHGDSWISNFMFKVSEVILLPGWNG